MLIARLSMFLCEHCGTSSMQPGHCPHDGHPLVSTAGDPMLGIEVGRYRLVRLIGHGGMGRVYAAIQPQLGSRVAIKVLSEDAAASADLVERFFAEARTASSIHHEGIVKIFDLTRLPGGRPAIIMELVDGRTLRDVVRDRHVTLGAVVQIMVEVLSAVAAAHEVGLVHRDLKPDNILVTTRGRAKVLDFGIAKLSANPPFGTPRTQTGAVIGTPAYMSPEQVSGGTVDARSDVYAAGVVLFEAVTGRLPFAGLAEFDVMRAHLEIAPPSPRALRPDLPPAIESVILRALAKDPRDRFPSASAMGIALHAAAAGLPRDQMYGLSPIAPVFPSQTSLPPGAATMVQRSRVQAETVRDASRSTDAPTIASRPNAKHAERRPAMWRRLAIPVLAACVGTTIVGLAVHSPSPSPPPDAPPAAVVVTTEPAPSPDAAVPGPDAALPDAAVATRPTPPPDARVPVATTSHDHPPKKPAIAPPPTDGALEQDGPRRWKKAIEYDPHHFDVQKFLPRARALARQIAPDAELTAISVWAILRDGTMDLHGPVGRSTGVRIDYRASGENCSLSVLPVDHHILVWAEHSDCDRPRRVPRCTIRQVIARSEQGPMGTLQPDELIDVEFSYARDGRWQVQPPRRTHLGFQTLEDDCP